MQKFRVVCREEVSTELYVEAPDEATLKEWLENDEGADLVSEHTDRQVVHERDYEVEVWNGSEAVDGRCPVK